jgi:hypothetical protein
MYFRLSFLLLMAVLHIDRHRKGSKYIPLSYAFSTTWLAPCACAWRLFIQLDEKKIQP